MSKVFSAKVKNVLSSDTIVLTPTNGSQQERTLSLAYLQAPRISSNEKYAFEARDLLRNLLVGKQINFWVLYKNNSEREFGDISCPVFQSLIEYVLSKGAAKLRDNLNSFDDENIDRLKEIESKAQSDKVGIWDPNYSNIELVNRPEASVIDQSVKEPIHAIVEKVISGDRLLVRLILSPKVQCVLPVLIAGVRTPRTESSDEPGEPFSEEAKKYVENRLLSKDIKVSFIGESSSGVLVAKIIHPAGNISEKLLSDGLAEVADWQSSLVGAAGMSILRKLEKSAKTSGKNIWKSHAATAASKSISSSGSDIQVGMCLSAVVARVISSDTLVLRLKDDSEITVQLASLRAPRLSDPYLSVYAPIAKEFVRKKVRGKNVMATIESIRPANEQYEERPMVTIKTANGTNLSDDIVSFGYASVIRHRKGDDKPDYWDSLVESETQAIKGKRGIHGKAPEPEKLVDASENAMKAKPYLFSFQNRSKISGIVEHVISGTRFRVYVPGEGVRLILVLGGLKNSGSRDDEQSQAAFALANKKIYQRDISMDIYGADRVGGFIGNLYLQGSNVPFQINLLKDGLVETHDRSLAQTKMGNQFIQAENEAKVERLGIWKNYDPAKEQELSNEQLTKQVESLRIEKEYVDAEVCEILDNGLIAMHLDSEKNKLKPFMQKLHAASSTFKPFDNRPKRGELVAAKLSDNGKFYRAKCMGFSKTDNSVTVQHIDYGTIENVFLSELRALPSEYSTTALKPQAHITQLSLINLPPVSQPEYFKESIYYLEDNLLDKQVVACITFKNPSEGVEFDAELYDSETISEDPTRSINKDMVEQGYGIVKKKNLAAFELLLKSEREELLALEEKARKAHLGCWKFGDVEDDDD